MLNKSHAAVSGIPGGGLRRMVPGGPPVVLEESGFRPDIQALRALAVLSVLLYHLWPERLTGGFIGVDVFFVISGYLITSHLVRERATTGRIAIGRFWARRAVRLLPASLLVLAVTAVAILIWAPRSLWQQFFGEIAASALYVQNWKLLFDSVDYLAADNTPSPVQHFWTLSAEEQFYIVLPLLLILGTLLLRRLPWRAVMVGLLAVTVVASLAYSLWLTGWSAGEAYFSTLTRAWEFGLGALVSFLPARLGARAATVFTGVGVAMIFVSTLAITGETPFPGVAALLPVVGAALAVWAGRASALRHIGALAPVRFLGDTSYAVYLWHWPVIVILPYVTGHVLYAVDKVGIIAATLVLAWLSTRFVENPVRFSPRLLARRQPRFVAVWAAAGMACVLAVAVTAGEVMRSQEYRAEAASAAFLTGEPECLGAQSMDPHLAPCENPALEVAPLVPALAEAHKDTDNRGDCWAGSGVRDLNICTMGPERAYERRLVVLGDSHSNVFVGAWEEIAERNNWRIDLAGHAGCYWSDGPLPLPTQDQTDACTTWRQHVADYVATAVDVDAFAVRRSTFGKDAEPQVVEGMVAAWAARPDLDVPVIAIRDNPFLPKNTMQCIEVDPDTAERRCSRPVESVLHDDGHAAAVARDPNAFEIDLTEFFCDETRCMPVIGGVVVYRDGQHITATYASTLAPYLFERVAAVLEGRAG